MGRSISALTLVVRDYDEAIAFFTESLRFTLPEDTPLGQGKRWLRMAPAGSSGAALLLARAATPPSTSQPATGDRHRQKSVKQRR